MNREFPVITEKDIEDLCTSASVAGFVVDAAALTMETWGAGESHLPRALPPGKAAVYVFVLNGNCLKVGKANKRSNARYQSQHYNPKSCRSNLALSLLADAEFQPIITSGNAGGWIRQNTTRYNILIPEDLGPEFVHFAEAFFILKFRPRFEGG